MNINSIYGNSTAQNQIGENSIGKEIEKSTNIYQKDFKGINTDKPSNLRTWTWYL